MKKQERFSTIQEFSYHFAVAAVLLLTATLVNYLIIALYGKNVNVSGIYLLAVILISLFTGSYFWGMLSAVCSVVGTNFCFTYPYFAIDFSLSGYPLTFLIMAAVAVGSCALTVNMRKQRDEAHLREQFANNLNEMDRKLLQIDAKAPIVDLLLEYLYTQLERPVLYFELQGNKITCLGYLGDVKETLQPAYYEVLCQSLQRVRQGMEENTAAGFLNIPVARQDKVFGVACILFGDEILSAEMRSYAQGLVNHFAIAFERQELSEAQHQILLEKQAEQTRSYLLRAISHDLRTPLTGILGASGAILDNGERIQPELSRRLMQDIHEEAQWLLRMIENVLSVTKIGNYNPELKKTLEPVEEVLADSVARCKKYFPDLKIEIHLPDDFIMLPMDPILIRQVVTNLIDNAYRHGNSKEKIELDVQTDEQFVSISVQDYGKGLPQEDLKQLFYGLKQERMQGGDGARGLGLGMTICKTIVEAHDGKIFAENIEGKGLKVTFQLPVEEVA